MTLEVPDRAPDWINKVGVEWWWKEGILFSNDRDGVEQLYFHKDKVYKYAIKKGNTFADDEVHKAYKKWLIDKEIDKILLEDEDIHE